MSITVSAGHSGTKAAELTRIPPEEALRLADLIARRVRGTAAPVARQFIRSADGSAPPIAQCLRGGRGGEVRLKLLLSIVWVARKAPYDTKYAARAWAELLGLEDPQEHGARRVNDAIAWLSQANLLRVEPQPGRQSVLYLLNGAGTGAPYQPPHQLKQPYVQVPASLWTNGWISVLSGPAVAILLVLLDQALFSDAAKPIWLSPARAKNLYALSPDTWTKATKELQQYGIVEKIRKPVSEDFDQLRFRNTFRLKLDQLNKSP